MMRADREAWNRAIAPAREAAASLRSLFPFSGGRGRLGELAETLSRFATERAIEYAAKGYEAVATLGAQHHEAREWLEVEAEVAELIAQAPAAFRRGLRREFLQVAGERGRVAAADWLRGEVWRRYVSPAGLIIDASEAAIESSARQAADWCKGLADRLDGAELVAELISYARSRGVELSADGPPGPLVRRCCDVVFWRRRLRRIVSRAYEAEARRCNLIVRRRQVYCSDHAVTRRRERTAATRAALADMIAESPGGAAISVLEAAEASVANPAIRRGELMARIRGFEQEAERCGHVGRFITLTLPSRWHRARKNGRPNPRWEGATPRDGQRELCRVWARARAAWKRLGFEAYGFRIAEPHHDGTPHWHLLLFGDAGQWPAALDALRRYAMAEAPDEAGAAEHRLTVVEIDPGQGTAAGYVAKYVAKSVDGRREDGESIGADLDARADATVTSERVVAWASRWGIRQFTQIGGPSVTIWRELRRIAEAQPVPELETPREAADAGAWAPFVESQGGPAVARHARPLRLWWERAELCGMYGDVREVIRGVEVTAAPAFGLVPAGIVPQVFRALSRPFSWTIRREPSGERFSAQRAQRASTRTRGNNCTPDAAELAAMRARLGLPEPTPPPKKVRVGLVSMSTEAAEKWTARPAAPALVPSSRLACEGRYLDMEPRRRFTEADLLPEGVERVGLVTLPAEVAQRWRER